MNWLGIAICYAASGHRTMLMWRPSSGPLKKIGQRGSMPDYRDFTASGEAEPGTSANAGMGGMYDPVEIEQDPNANRVPDQHSLEGCKAESAPPIVVTLVHGTFAKGAPWTKDGSTLRCEIAQALGEYERDVAFDVFEWSGRNSHRARVKAGYELARHIRALRTANPNSHHFIVAHSHGGNVALLSHKHLDEEFHAIGIATLGTPFLYAKPRGDLSFKTLRMLEREAIEENQVAAAMFAFVVTLTAMAMFGTRYEKTLEYAWGWALAVGLVLGYATRPLFQKFVTPHLARLLFLFSGKRAARRLADAIAFGPVPNTHILSIVYPRDEAGLVLDALELTTKAPTWIMEKILVIGMLLLAPVFLLGPFAGFANVVAAEIFEFDGEKVGELAASLITGAITGLIGLYLIVGAIRYVLALLRGHPAGFGWERPSIHTWADVGATTSAEIEQAKSNVTETVPYKPGASRSGLRHSGLYEDGRILKALAYWMAHVR